MEGKVKVYDAKRKFGFIKYLDSNGKSKDIYFQESDVGHYPVFFKINNPVVFDIFEYYGKFKAVDILKLDKFGR